MKTYGDDASAVIEPDRPIGANPEGEASPQLTASPADRAGVSDRFRGLTQRPVLVTATAGLVFTIVQFWWNTTYRRLGAFNVDEEGGLAAAFRFHRSIGLDPRPLLREVFSTWNGPLVPLTSVPGLLLGPNTVQVVMIAQSLIVVAAACATAGIVMAIGHRRAAFVSGLLMLLLPVSVASARSYQYSTGVAACMALALWALVASDRGNIRWRMIAFGVATGAMTLCRTMAVGFVPGLAIAALFVVRRDRRGITNTALAAAGAIAVAGPWWYTQWDSITEYLRFNAYGSRAHYWGSVAMADRVSDHIRYFFNDFTSIAVFGLSVVAVSIVGALVWMAVHRRMIPLTGSRRGLLAVWVVAVAGRIVLLSTSNLGFWFAYPLNVPMIAGAVALIAALPVPTNRWLRHWKAVPATICCAFVVVAFLVSLSVPSAGELDENDWRNVFVSNHASLQGGNLEADPRLESTDAAVRNAAAHQWWTMSERLTKEIDSVARRSGGTVLQTVIGEIHLMNANTIGLAEEVTTTGINGIQVVNTLEPPDNVLRQDLGPKLNGVPRVLVIIRGRSLGFPNGRGRDRFVRLAREEGWRSTWQTPMPDGGKIELYTNAKSIPNP